MSPSHLCAECHTGYEAKAMSRGRRVLNSAALIFIGLCLFCTGTAGGAALGLAVLIVGGIYLERLTKPKCPACGCRRALPIDSPAAKKITGD